MTLLLALLSTVIWRGDYETGDLSQWDRVDGLTSMLTVVNSPVHQGSSTRRA